MCIYYKDNNSNVKFTKEEHIVPAGLGGKMKLPLGYVSDIANELFSPSEMKIQRDSFLSINRMNYGPGKRGSLNIKRNKSPIIRVLKNENNVYGAYSLGFIFAGEAFIIMQASIVFNVTEDSYRPYYYGTPPAGSNPELVMSDFKEKLIKFLTAQNPSYIIVNPSTKSKSKFINLGFYEGKWFITTSGMKVDLDFVKKDLLLDLLKERLREGLGMSNKKSLVSPPFYIITSIKLIQMPNYFILYM